MARDSVVALSGDLDEESKNTAEQRHKKKESHVARIGVIATHSIPLRYD